MILRIVSRVHTRLGGCSCNTCERSTTSGVKDMVLGLTPTIRYRPASSIEFNDRDPFLSMLCRLNRWCLDAPALLEIGMRWGRSVSRIDMVNPNMFPAGSRSLHVLQPCFFPAVCRYSFNRVKALDTAEVKRAMHNVANSVSSSC